MKSVSQDEDEGDFEMVDREDVDDGVSQSPSQVDSDEMYLPAVAVDSVKLIESTERKGTPSSQLFVNDGRRSRDSNMGSRVDDTSAVVTASSPKNNRNSAIDKNISGSGSTFIVKKVQVTKPSASEKRLELIKAALDAKKIDEENIRTEAQGAAAGARGEPAQHSNVGVGASALDSTRPPKKPRVSQDLPIASASNLPTVSVTQADTPVKRGNRVKTATPKAAAGGKVRASMMGKGKAK